MFSLRFVSRAQIAKVFGQYAATKIQYISSMLFDKWGCKTQKITEAFSEPCQTSKMKFFGNS